MSAREPGAAAAVVAAATGNSIPSATLQPEFILQRNQFKIPDEYNDQTSSAVPRSLSLLFLISHSIQKRACVCGPANALSTMHKNEMEEWNISNNVLRYRVHC